MLFKELSCELSKNQANETPARPRGREAQRHGRVVEATTASQRVRPRLHACRQRPGQLRDAVGCELSLNDANDGLDLRVGACPRRNGGGCQRHHQRGDASGPSGAHDHVGNVPRCGRLGACSPQSRPVHAAVGRAVHAPPGTTYRTPRQHPGVFDLHRLEVARVAAGSSARSGSSRRSRRTIQDPPRIDRVRRGHEDPHSRSSARRPHSDAGVRATTPLRGQESPGNHEWPAGPGCLRFGRGSVHQRRWPRHRWLLRSTSRDGSTASTRSQSWQRTRPVPAGARDPLVAPKESSASAPATRRMRSSDACTPRTPPPRPIVGNGRSVSLPPRASGMTFRARLFRSGIVFVAG